MGAAGVSDAAGKSGAKVSSGGTDTSRSSGLAGAQPGFSKSFLSESIEELKKITTPTRQETIQAMIMTVMIIIFMSLCVFLLDLVFNGIMSSIL